MTMPKPSTPAKNKLFSLFRRIRLGETIPDKDFEEAGIDRFPYATKCYFIGHDYTFPECNYGIHMISRLRNFSRVIDDISVEDTRLARGLFLGEEKWTHEIISKTLHLNRSTGLSMKKSFLSARRAYNARKRGERKSARADPNSIKSLPSLSADNPALALNCQVESWIYCLSRSATTIDWQKLSPNVRARLKKSFTELVKSIDSLQKEKKNENRNH